MAKDLALNIYSRRTELKMSQLELATEIGSTQSNVACWETRRTKPNFDYFMKLCDALNVTPNQLSGYERN